MKLWKIVVVVMLAGLVTGCNTARGFGADLEVLGQKMQNMGTKKKVASNNTVTHTEVVEVPTTYQSQSTSGYTTYETYPADSGYQTSGDVYTQAYPVDGSDTTYTTIPDAVTYPVEDSSGQ